MLCHPQHCQAQPYSKNSVSSDRDHDEMGSHRDVENLRVRRQKHSQLKSQGHQHGPGPMAASGVAKHSDVHDAKGRAVAEMVNPSQDLGHQRVRALFDWLTKNHCSKAREDFEKLHWWDHGGDTPFFCKDEREPESVVGKRGEQEDEDCKQSHLAQTVEVEQ